MRENRTYGSEGGETGTTGLPYPYSEDRPCRGFTGWRDGVHRACAAVLSEDRRSAAESRGTAWMWTSGLRRGVR
jgi:hypothetical protein